MPDDERPAAPAGPSFVARQKCSACGFPVGITREDLGVRAARCPVCEAHLDVTPPRALEDGPFRTAAAVALSTRATSAVQRSIASGRITIDDTPDGRAIAVKGRAVGLAKAAAMAAGLTATLVLLAAMDGMAIGAAILPFGFLGLVAMGLFTFLTPAHERARKTRDGVVLTSSAEGYDQLQLVAAGKATFVDIERARGGHRRLRITVGGDRYLFGDATKLSEAEAVWLADQLQRWIDG